MNQPLFYRMAHFGSRSHYGPGALSSLVAINASFNAPCYGAAYQRTTHLVDAYSSTQHLKQHIGNNFVVDNKHHNRQKDVDYSHYRSHNLGHVSNAFNTANNHQSDEKRYHNSYHPRGHTKGT